MYTFKTLNLHALLMDKLDSKPMSETIDNTLLMNELSNKSAGGPVSR